MKKTLSLLALAGALLILGVAALAAGQARLMMNGKVASSDVRVIGGKSYVPIADVAKSLGMVVVKWGDGYEIKKPGGASQVGNLSGKIGDVLFDGKWRFQVLSVTNPASYTIKSPEAEPLGGASDLVKWDSKTQVMRAVPRYHLVQFGCRVTNGQKTQQRLWTAPNDAGIHTALTDMEGGAHVPAAYDYPGAAIQTKPMLPGQITNFNLLFSVPDDTRLKDLVFSLKNNDSFAKPTDVRVALGVPVE